jgi:hypothetical protein
VLETGKIELEMRWACSTEVCSVWEHRTVRWCTGQCPVRQASSCTGLSGEPTVGRANGRPRNPRATRGRANGRKGAPDCPVCTVHVRCTNGSLAANGRLCRRRKEIGHRTLSGVHRTVRCARRQKARMAFQICSQWLLAALGL